MLLHFPTGGEAHTVMCEHSADRGSMRFVVRPNTFPPANAQTTHPLTECVCSVRDCLGASLPWQLCGECLFCEEKKSKNKRSHLRRACRSPTLIGINVLRWRRAPNTAWCLTWAPMRFTSSWTELLFGLKKKSFVVDTYSESEVCMGKLDHTPDRWLLI